MRKLELLDEFRREAGRGKAGEDELDGVLDQRTPVTIRYGRDQARQLSPVAGGELACELDNRSHDYSPENTASPLAGYVTSGRKVSFKATTSSTEKPRP